MSCLAPDLPHNDQLQCCDVLQSMCLIASGPSAAQAPVAGLSPSDKRASWCTTSGGCILPDSATAGCRYRGARHEALWLVQAQRRPRAGQQVWRRCCPPIAPRAVFAAGTVHRSEVAQCLLPLRIDAVRHALRCGCAQSAACLANDASSCSGYQVDGSLRAGAGARTGMCTHTLMHAAMHCFSAN